MDDSHSPSFRIRPARPEDVPELLTMIRELAVFERLSHQVVATDADYQQSLFGDPPAAEAFIGEVEGAPAGYAIFFTTFSSFLGRPGIWLEDIYVRPAHRGIGLGKALFKAVGAIARERHAGRYEWTVLDWNQHAITFYEKMRAEVLPDWRIVRLDRDRLHSLTEGPDLTKRPR